MSTGIMDQSMEYLADVHNTYGIFMDLTANLSLSTSEKKLPLKTFTGSGCTSSSNGIKVNKAGVYEISGTAYFHSGFTVNDIVHLQLWKNSTLLEDFGQRLSTANPYENVNISPYIISLAANDVIYMYAYNQTGSRGQINTGATRTFMMLNRIA